MLDGVALPFIIIDHGQPAIANYQNIPSKGTVAVNKSTSVKNVSVSTKDHQDHTTVHSENPYLNTPSSPHRVYLAKELMSEPVIFLDSLNASVEQAWEIMQRHHIKHLPVVKHKKLFGIISERDVLHALAFKTTPNKNWFIKKVYAASGDTDIQQITHTMFDQHIGSMPIIDNEQKLIGLITRSDILKLTSRYGPMEFWA